MILKSLTVQSSKQISKPFLFNTLRWGALCLGLHYQALLTAASDNSYTFAPPDGIFIPSKCAHIFPSVTIRVKKLIIIEILDPRALVFVYSLLLVLLLFIDCCMFTDFF